MRDAAIRDPAGNLIRINQRSAGELRSTRGQPTATRGSGCVGARVNNLKDVERRDPQAPADRVHRGLGIGQELAGVRHDRGRIAAADQRDLQRVRAGLHADPGPSRRRRAGGLTTAIIVDQERMGSDPRSTVGTVTDANAMLRILFSRLAQPHIGPPQAFSFNVASVAAQPARSPSSAAAARPSAVRRASASPAGCARAARARGSVSDIDLTALYDETKSLQRRCAAHPRLQHGRLVRPDLPRLRLLRPGQADQRSTPRGNCTTCCTRNRRRSRSSGINLTYEGLIPASRSRCCPRTSSRCSRTSARSSSERSPSAPARTAPAPGCRRGGRSSQDRRGQHRRRVRDADQRPGRLGRGVTEPSVAPLIAALCAHPGLVRRHRTGLPRARPRRPARCPAARRSGRR